MKFYTHVSRSFGKILVRGYEDGIRFQEEVDYQPYTFINTNANTPYKTIDGKPVGKVTHGSMKEATQFVERYKGVIGKVLVQNGS